MSATTETNVSADLIWEVVRKQNAYLVKRKTFGGVRFSRDPFNLTNTHSRKHAGFVNDKAVSLTHGKDGHISFKSKSSKKAHQPVNHHSESSHASHKPGRKTYASVANKTAKNSYRPDLRQAAVSRASAIRKSQRPVKPSPESKRGKKASKTAEEP